MTDARQTGSNVEQVDLPEDVAAPVPAVRGSWDEWLADHADAWPTDDDAPDAFMRIP